MSFTGLQLWSSRVRRSEHGYRPRSRVVRRWTRGGACAGAVLAVWGCQAGSGEPAARAEMAARGGAQRPAPQIYAPPEAAVWFVDQVERLAKAAPDDMEPRVAAALRALSANARALSGSTAAASFGAAADRLEGGSADSAGGTALVASAFESASAALATSGSTRSPARATLRREHVRRFHEALDALDPESDLEGQRARVVAVFQAAANLVYFAYGAVPPYPAEAREPELRQTARPPST